MVGTTSGHADAAVTWGVLHVGRLDSGGSQRVFLAALSNQTALSVVNSSMPFDRAWFLQRALHIACGQPDMCSAEAVHAVLLVSLLSAVLIAVLCMFAFVRDDKEDHITPLCPQLVVRDAAFAFRLPTNFVNRTDSDILNNSDEIAFKLVMDWTDASQFANSGVSATARLVSIDESVFATVVARNVYVANQGLALCRAGCEIFGFVEPLPDRKRYIVRHRTGIHLLTLVGDFDTFNIEGYNPVGTSVCSFKQCGDECVVNVLQHVDAGLVVCALLAASIHRTQIKDTKKSNSVLTLSATRLAEPYARVAAVNVAGEETFALDLDFSTARLNQVRTAVFDQLGVERGLLRLLAPDGRELTTSHDQQLLRDLVTVR